MGAGDDESWDHPNPSQRQIQQLQPFAKGTWGGEWHPDFVPHADDIIIQEHWAQSGFANTVSCVPRALINPAPHRHFPHTP
jgi:nicotinamidase-related amidase